MFRTALMIGVVSLLTTADMSAQQDLGRYQVGGRSALILGSMDLSGIDPAFDDLGFDGIKGPHHSGLFFLVRVKPYLRVGIETLVANSDQDAVTTMNYQAAGPVAEVFFGDPWVVAGGLHVGGMIANAMARQDDPSPAGVGSGSFYKNSGAFLAPFGSVGVRLGRYEVRAFVKAVAPFGEDADDGMSDFGAWFAGIRYAITL